MKYVKVGEYNDHHLEMKVRTVDANLTFATANFAANNRNATIIQESTNILAFRTYRIERTINNHSISGNENTTNTTKVFIVVY